MAVPKWAVSADSLSATGLTGSAYAAPVQSSTRMATLAIVLSMIARVGRIDPAKAYVINWPFSPLKNGDEIA